MYSVREIAQVCDEQAFDAANASGEQDQPLRVLDSQRFHRAMYLLASLAGSISSPERRENAKRLASLLWRGLAARATRWANASPVVAVDAVVALLRAADTGARS